MRKVVYISLQEIHKNQPLVQEELEKLFKKGVVVKCVKCEHEAAEYIVLFFLREKTDET